MFVIKIERKSPTIEMDKKGNLKYDYGKLKSIKYYWSKNGWSTYCYYVYPSIEEAEIDLKSLKLTSDEVPIITFPPIH